MYSKKYFFCPISVFFQYIIYMDAGAFWKRVKNLIKAHNVSQEKFAAHLGMPLSTLKGWIFHNRIPDVESAFVMAAALGVTVDYLVYGKENDTVEEEKKRRSTVKEAAVRLQALQDQMREDMDIIRDYF